MLTDLVALPVVALNHNIKISCYCLSTYSYLVLHRVQYLLEIYTAYTVKKFICVPHSAHIHCNMFTVVVQIALISIAISKHSPWKIIPISID